MLKGEKKGFWVKNVLGMNEINVVFWGTSSFLGLAISELSSMHCMAVPSSFLLFSFWGRTEDLKRNQLEELCTYGFFFLVPFFGG